MTSPFVIIGTYVLERHLGFKTLTLFRTKISLNNDTVYGVRQMQTADFQTDRLYIVLLLPSLIANQANRSVIFREGPLEK